MPTKKYRVQGRVQGVSFRAFTQQKAMELNVRGWVKNLPDGSVEARASADAATLLQFESYLRQGPAYARVSQLDIEDVTQAEDQKFPGFEILL